MPLKNKNKDDGISELKEAILELKEINLNLIKLVEKLLKKLKDS